MNLPESDIEAAPRTVGFFLVPGFALLSYAAAVEPLRAANLLSGRPLYRWLNLTADGRPAAASSGLSVAAGRPAPDAAGLDALIVCAGGHPAAWGDRAALRFLRGLARRKVAVGGVSGGPWLLARAGLLDGRRCTIHWEHAAAFAEAFPRLDLRRTLFEIDGPRMSCAGGVAALDMMTALIARDHGAALARRVADWFVQARAREGGDTQRMGLRERTGVANRAVLAALAAMEAHVETPLDGAALARAAGLGRRQLERLFRLHLGETMGARYRAIRLARARVLLRETSLGLPEIAAASGFVSAGHFSRAFRDRFGLPPGRYRRAAA